MKIFKNCVSGSRGVVNQIARRILLLNEIKRKMATTKKSQDENLFIQELFENEDLKKDYCVSDEGTMMMGEQESMCNNVRTFDRCYHKKCKYESKIYSRPRKTMSYFAQLEDDQIVEIQSFSLNHNECNANVRYLTVGKLSDLELSHIFSVNSIADTIHEISLERIKSKVIFLQIFDTNKKYICIPINKIMPF